MPICGKKRFATQNLKPEPLLIPSAEPFLFLGQPDRPAVLLIHGFTSSPKEVRWMGEYLHAQGFTCLGVRLSGHATRPEDMIRSRYIDWMASVEDGYHLLRGLASRIFLAGISTGGALALLMSTRLDVQGVVAISTLDGLPKDYPFWLLKAASLVMPYSAKTNQAPGASWYDKEAFKTHVAYPANPVRSVAELKLLLAEMNAALPNVRVPVLLVHSRDDKYVRPESMPRIHARVGSSEKEMFWVTESGHVVTRDAKRAEVFAAASAFIQRVESNK